MRIDRYKTIDKEGSSLKASFNVIIPEWDLTLRMTYFEKPTGESWFGYPSQQYVNEFGEKKHSWLAFFGEKGKPRFEKSLREELNKFLAQPNEPKINFDEQDIPF